ncbi:M6 family metalloprotease domain-containing protein [Eubacterium sp. 1001713B170207_170306_E7]|uniref:M6 family metalloprotease domain-containing protein n=1 Tax=Eubacterium sp. 1001713B170207_170306_E7 TaxID=2787097 RepID=UPI001897B0BE|nr:M6 family metalloprotease domain-containing protein [Eubacterium sp. 1001713B170207_170306_E7]
MNTRVKHYGFAALLLLLLLWLLTPGASAQETASSPCIPNAEMLESYRADGSLAERQAYYERLSLNQTDPGLIAQAQAREAGAANLRSVPSDWKTGMATTGQAKILLIRVDFPDYSFDDADTKAALEKIAFGPSGSDQPGYPYESLAAYYGRSSYGKLNITGQVASYTAANNRDTYSLNMVSLFKEAMTALDAQGMDFSQFDGNGDGLIDGVYIHFAGPDTGWSSPWWSQKEHYGSEPFVLDGVALSDYVLLHENSAYGAQTLIHETGHMLGLADYYSYTAQTYENGIRTFDMMCDNSGDHNGFSKWLLGWLDPEDITRVSAADGNMELALKAISDSGGSKIAVVSPTDSGMFSEYFLVQYDVPGLNNEGLNYPNMPDSGFRIFHINATLNAEGSNFLYMNTTPTAPKLIEAVGPENQSMPFSPLFYTDGMRLAPDTTPDSSFFGGMYQAYTGAVFENLNTQNASLSVRFESTPPVVPSLTLTPDSPLDNLTNLPSFTFTANIPVNDNPSDDARQPITLEGPDGVSYPMHCAINEKSLALGPADSANIADLKANMTYTLVFPEKYFDLGQGVTSEKIRFTVSTGDGPVIQSNGVLLDQPSSFGCRETDLAALSDGRIFRLMGTYKPSGETHFNYFDRVQLLIVDSDFQTTLLNVESIPNIEAYSDIQGFALTGDTLALGLYNKTADATDLFLVDLNGRVLAGPYTVSGSPTLFPAGDKVKAWQPFYGSGEVLPGIQIETIDFKNPVTSCSVYGEQPNSELKLLPLDAGQYAVWERASTGLWEHKDYLALYSMDSDTQKWRTECTSTNTVIGAAAQKDGVVLIETGYLGEGSAASFSSSYRSILGSFFDADGNLMDKSKVLGRVRTGETALTSVFSVKNGPSGIAVESLFTAPALPYLENNNDTECRDYLFISSDGQTVRAISGQNAFPGLWTGDRYLITGLDLSTGDMRYYQTETVFSATPDTPDTLVTPVTPGTPGGSSDAGVDGSGSVSTGLLGPQASLYCCLGLLGAALCGLAAYRKSQKSS